MNDFTIEELEYLKETIEFDIKELHAQHPALEALEKIQLLIEIKNRKPTKIKCSIIRDINALGKCSYCGEHHD